MIRAGLAWHYKKYQKEQSKLDRNFYEVADNFVKCNSLGLFQDKNAMPPWEWRKLKRDEYKRKKAAKQ